MWMKLIGTGGYIMLINELANKAKSVREARTRDQQRARAKGMAIGAGIGAAAGIVGALLFAPKSGRETREIIGEKTGQTMKNFKKKAAEAKENLSSSVAQKGAKLREAGQECVDDAKESVKQSEGSNKKKK